MREGADRSLDGCRFIRDEPRFVSDLFCAATNPRPGSVWAHLLWIVLHARVPPRQVPLVPRNRRLEPARFSLSPFKPKNYIQMRHIGSPVST